MSKEQLVSDAKAALAAAQDAALGSLYDGAFAEGVASVPPADANEQEKIDAAVKAATDPLNAQIAALQAQDASDVQAGKDALAAAQAAMTDLQTKFDALALKEGQESSVISGLQGSLVQMQQVVALLQNILNPPAPPPAPAPAPEVPAS